MKGWVRYGIVKRLGALAVEALVAPWASAGTRWGNPPQRVLIVEPFRLGDAALLRGMVLSVLASDPRIEAHLLLHPACADLYEGWDRVKVHAIHLPWVNAPGRRSGWSATWRLARNLAAKKFDLGLDPRGDVRSQVLLVLAGCRERVGPTAYIGSDIRLRGRLLTRPAGDPRGLHRTAVHDAVLAAAGFPPAPAIPLASKPASSHRLVAICPGAGWSYRLWPAERWGVVVRRLAALPGVRVRLVASAAERGLLDAILGVCGGTVEVVVCRRPSELLAALGDSNLVIALDSAPMHLASEWLGCPVLALFGPGVPDLYRPRSAGSRILGHGDRYACWPCRQIRCVRPADPCMLAVGVDEVVEAAFAMLAEGRPAAECP